MEKKIQIPEAEYWHLGFLTSQMQLKDIEKQSLSQEFNQTLNTLLDLKEGEQILKVDLTNRLIIINIPEPVIEKTPEAQPTIVEEHVNTVLDGESK